MKIIDLLIKVTDGITGNKIISDEKWVEKPVPEYPKWMPQRPKVAPRPVNVDYRLVDGIAIVCIFAFIVFGWVIS